MAKEKKTEVAENQQAAPAIEFINDVNVPIEVRQEIVKKAEELKAQHKLRKIFIIVVEGEEGDDKPLYIAYLRRPSLIHFSQYMNFVQKDLVQASKMLATNVFLAGDRELVDDDELFLYGTMQQLNHLIDSRNADMVKQ
jgi:hypothetical protein